MIISSCQSNKIRYIKIYYSKTFTISTAAAINDNARIIYWRLPSWDEATPFLLCDVILRDVTGRREAVRLKRLRIEYTVNASEYVYWLINKHKQILFFLCLFLLVVKTGVVWVSEDSASKVSDTRWVILQCDWVLWTIVG